MSLEILCFFDNCKTVVLVKPFPAPLINKLKFLFFFEDKIFKVCLILFVPPVRTTIFLPTGLLFL